MTEMSEDAVVLSFHESLLRRSDVDLLRGDDWLNDNIISFYLEYLEKAAHPGDDTVLFVSPEVTQCLKMVEGAELALFLGPLGFAARDYVFFVLNDNNSGGRAGGSHWSLLVYSKLEKTFFHLDSLDNGISLEARVLFGNFQRYFDSIGESGNSMRLAPLKCLRQENSFDCGVHVICNVDNIIDHIVHHDKFIEKCSPTSPSSVKNKRKELIELIEELAKK